MHAAAREDEDAAKSGTVRLRHAGEHLRAFAKRSDPATRPPDRREHGHTGDGESVARWGASPGLREDAQTRPPGPWRPTSLTLKCVPRMISFGSGGRDSCRAAFAVAGPSTTRRLRRSVALPVGPHGRRGLRRVNGGAWQSNLKTGNALRERRSDGGGGRSDVAEKPLDQCSENGFISSSVRKLVVDRNNRPCVGSFLGIDACGRFLFLRVKRWLQTAE